MPANYTIDVKRKLVISIGEGALNLPECREHSIKLRADPAFRPEFDQLMDLTGVTSGSMSSDDVKQLAEITVFSPKSRRAFVATDSAVYGLCRMFEMYRDCQGETGIAVFRDRREALAWLGITDPNDEFQMTDDKGRAAPGVGEGPPVRRPNSSAG